mmetsp:Transcript_70279/g.139265  ORF Transcript_70279/g.139265 Transcript_70279/m.139265 type:complete len:204 (-) Transcript_70279:862-1473(-)
MAANTPAVQRTPPEEVPTAEPSCLGRSKASGNSTVTVDAIIAPPEKPCTRDVPTSTGSGISSSGCPTAGQLLTSTKQQRPLMHPTLTQTIAQRPTIVGMLNPPAFHIAAEEKPSGMFVNSNAKISIGVRCPSAAMTPMNTASGIPSVSRPNAHRNNADQSNRPLSMAPAPAGCMPAKKCHLCHSFRSAPSPFSRPRSRRGRVA